ncbi:hypothetical protein Tco_0303906 [Tanacetum coccineum]
MAMMMSINVYIESLKLSHPTYRSEVPDISLNMGGKSILTLLWETEKSSSVENLVQITTLKLTPSIPFVLENPSSSPIPVGDSDILIEEIDTFLVSEDSIPPGIESDLGSEEDIIFLDNLLNNDPIPEYEHFIFDIEPDAPVINNFDELNEDECFDPGGGEIDASQNIEDDDSFAFVIRTFLPMPGFEDSVARCVLSIVQSLLQSFDAFYFGDDNPNLIEYCLSLAT